MDNSHVIKQQCCDRCKSECLVTIMSMFNTQVICIPCSNEEAAHPQYVDACEAESDSLLAGELNFAGIGLPEDLRIKYERDYDTPGT